MDSPARAGQLGELVHHGEVAAQCLAAERGDRDRQSLLPNVLSGSACR